MLSRLTCRLSPFPLVVFALASCSSATPPSPAVDVPIATDQTDVTSDPLSPTDVGMPARDVAPSDRPPNFVFILAEANGWTSTSVLEDEAIPASRSGTISTPNLDRVTAQGMRFSSFYAPSPRCMPTRASLLSGQSPAQLHMTFIPEARNDGASTGMVVPPVTITDLPTSTPTVASMLRARGYATAHFGKWHAGRTDPAQYGFDRSDGPTANRGPDNIDHPNPAQAYAITDRAIEFIDAQARSSRPFFVQVSSYGGKDEVDARPETYAMASARLPRANPRDVALAAVFMDMDINIGRILTRLDELGLTGNTYVIYTSDHGAPTNDGNAPLQQGKGTVWEGGIRVPLFVRGPNVRMGVMSRVRVSGVDLLPTIVTLAGGTSFPDNLEGGDLSGLFTGGATAVRRRREEFVVHFPHYDFDPLGPASTILLGDYKLTRFYETGSQRLFNLANDIGEAHDLAAGDPTRVTDMARRLDEYLAAVNAQIPTRR